ncbi:MAG: putative toxin-antitoxin system toxin component, PIN family [Candidatus Cloacimonetes bacterium]|nr:putative toxin-antitoxin system toxin component, PIN family [Candidatus Cloacimonadota bacterium]
MLDTPRVFLDTSVLIAALFSSKGASAEILKLARSGELEIFISQHVIEETRKTLHLKGTQLLPVFEGILKTKIFNVLPNPSKKEIDLSKLIVKDEKDVPILAIAMQEKVDYLVTLDRKDFIDDTTVAKKSRLKILTPGAFVKRRNMKMGNRT